MCLYTMGPSRLPRSGVRWTRRDTRRDALERLQADGMVRQVRPVVRFPGEHGGWDGLAAVYVLEPEYWRELAATDTRTPRRRGTAENVPDTLAAWLARGTGLRASLPRALELLLRPERLALEGTPEEIYRKALHAWRILAPYGPGELRLHWRISPRCGWLYSRRPCLQILPGPARLYALEGVDGMGLAEPDYSGCQLNILRRRQGHEPVDSPYEDIGRALRLHGLPELNRETLKAMVTPMLHGRKRQAFRWRFRNLGMEIAGRIYDTLAEVLESPGTQALMQEQGRMMLEALTAMQAAGIPSGLPVFDSITTPWPDVVEKAMRDAGEGRGGDIPVKTKTADNLRAAK